MDRPKIWLRTLKLLDKDIDINFSVGHEINKDRKLLNEIVEVLYNHGLIDNFEVDK